MPSPQRAIGTILVLVTSIAASLSCPSVATATTTTALADYTLVVFDDWTAGSNIAGKVAVGGNVIGNATDIAVGFDSTFPAGEVVFSVVGSISNGNDNIQVGSVEAGGDINANINLNQPGNTVSAGGSINGNVNSGVSTENVVGLQTALMAELAALESTLNDESDAFAELTANSFIDDSGSNSVVLVADPDANGQAVFDVTFEELFGDQNANLGLVFNGSEEIIINVTGQGTVRNNFAAEFTTVPYADRSKILWNFIDAQVLRTERQFFGSILAPNATLTNTTSIEGSVAVKSMTTIGQVHLPVPTIGSPLGVGVIPEPTSLLVWSALSAVGFSRRKR